MLPTFALFHSSAVVTYSVTVIVAVGLFAEFSLAISRSRLGQIRLFGVRESESVMNFSSLGTLRCVCGARHANQGASDRRRYCRTCGCEVVQQDAAALERHLSQREIKAMTRSLRRAAILARNLELPSSITSIAELNQYLESPEPKTPRNPPTQPTTFEQPQIH
jgi:hypothetical protein